MNNNSILKSGSTGKSSVYDKKSDSSFKTLSRILATELLAARDKIDTKLDKNITSDISLNNNRITNVKEPVNDNDVATKGYCVTILEAERVAGRKETISQIEANLQSVVNSKLSKFGDLMNGPLDMNFNSISNIKSPNNDNDAATKAYVDSLTGNQVGKTHIDLETLFKVAQKIQKVISKHETYRSELNSLVPSRRNFTTSLSQSIFMFEKYKSISEIHTRNINEISTCTMFADLKVNIVKIIENLPKDMLYELKDELALDPVDKGTTRKRFKRFLTKCAEDKNPLSEDLQLLLDKNILLIDLGFIYFMDSLLEYFLISISTS